MVRACRHRATSGDGMRDSSGGFGGGRHAGHRGGQRDGLTGSPKDAGRLAEAINVLLRDSFLRRSFGAAGRDRAQARYSWDRIAVDMLRIYDDLARYPRVTTPA